MGGWGVVRRVALLCDVCECGGRAHGCAVQRVSLSTTSSSCEFWFCVYPTLMHCARLKGMVTQEFVFQAGTGSLS